MTVYSFILRYSRRKRSVWVQPGRTVKWWEILYPGKMTNEWRTNDEWKNNFRMSKTDFLKLFSLVSPHTKERSARVRKDIITLEKRVAVTLYYLKDQGSMKMVANSFGMARCTGLSNSLWNLWNNFQGARPRIYKVSGGKRGGCKDDFTISFKTWFPPGHWLRWWYTYPWNQLRMLTITFHIKCITLSIVRLYAMLTANLPMSKSSGPAVSVMPACSLIVKFKKLEIQLVGRVMIAVSIWGELHPLMGVLVVIEWRSLRLLRWLGILHST